jgi:putative membrane protein
MMQMKKGTTDFLNRSQRLSKCSHYTMYAKEYILHSPPPMISLSSILHPSGYETPLREKFLANTFLKIACMIFLCVWVLTLTDIGDTTDWILENIPVFFWVGILLLTYRKFRFSDKSYLFILLFLALHIYGAKDVYSHNAFGNWLRDVTGSSRNNYDRIVHFSFGLLISYAMLDLFVNYLKWTVPFSFLAIVILNFAFGAFYEVLEWIVVAVFFPEQGSNFLGLQGDEWDSQKDIALGVVGSIVFIIIMFSILHTGSRTEKKSF